MHVHPHRFHGNMCVMGAMVCSQEPTSRALWSSLAREPWSPWTFSENPPQLPRAPLPRNVPLTWGNSDPVTDQHQAQGSQVRAALKGVWTESLWDWQGCHCDRPEFPFSLCGVPPASHLLASCTPQAQLSKRWGRKENCLQTSVSQGLFPREPDINKDLSPPDRVKVRGAYLTLMEDGVVPALLLSWMLRRLLTDQGATKANWKSKLQSVPDKKWTVETLVIAAKI